MSCVARRSVFKGAIADPPTNSDGAGTSVNSCTGSKVNEQPFDLTRCETGAAHTLSSSLAAR